MQIITTIDQMQQKAGHLLQTGNTIALVPTMGYLHEGHLALMREGRKHGDALVVSIFVNPTQFDPGEDLESYPRDMDRDAHLAESVGVDIIFAPEAEAMYGQTYQTHVDLEMLPRFLCGLSRPGHFRGVATVVTMLFNIVKPHVAVFGEKDYQQLVIIRRMVDDLNFEIRIIGVPIVREADGLALSSRNTYLSKDERRSALSLSHSLQQAQKSVAHGMKDARQVIKGALEHIRSYPYTKIDYVAVCDTKTLQDVDRIDGPSLMAMAVWVGKTRLIDNAILKP
ncbi:MAG: pantoate--beta-alanine ligase [Desulfobacterales bacterium C00003060]|nr:MAG: pantoate--beta-alanine ligase [Desulfobacterales bacterium S3730MH5]OEU81824.1 MAG: pantoate--beta-alanine ligase [Desulfobacterales bacterium C00003060]OEU82788.1 MAG: pantoate--beta-alanine ligase [Desulfobacterales bacterium S5133MH4]